METQVKIGDNLNPSPAGLQPKAYRSEGKGLYHLECSVSGLRTAKMPTYAEAVEAWQAMTAASEVRA